jgi:hypothetical protein
VKRPALALLALGLTLTLAVTQRVDGDRGASADHAARTVAAGETPRDGVLPRAHIFDGRMLVAYYGTAGTGALGVLGETSPDKAIARVRRAAAPFARNGLPAQPVFELIVTVADAHPGKDGDYNHDISRAAVQSWVDAARKAGALLVLDLQTGRADFPSVAKRWEWALREPHVGLAIDPEWRMGAGQVPGRTIGSVSAWEVNLTSRWLGDLTVSRGLPEKLFMVHQFRTSMIRNIGNVRTLTASALRGRSSRRTTPLPVRTSSAWASSSSTTRTSAGSPLRRSCGSIHASTSSASSSPAPNAGNALSDQLPPPLRAAAVAWTGRYRARISAGRSGRSP